MYVYMRVVHTCVHLYTHMCICVPICVCMHVCVYVTSIPFSIMRPSLPPAPCSPSYFPLNTYIADILNFLFLSKPPKDLDQPSPFAKIKS